MQPRRPQGHSSPPSTTTMWPISPAAPCAPAQRQPPSTIPPPTPEPANTTSRSSKPRPAPSRCSARVATLTSLPTRTCTPRASAASEPSGTGSSNPGRLAAPETRPVAVSTRPGEPSPTPASLRGETLALLAAALTTAAISATTAGGPPSAGVWPRASPSRPPSWSTTTPWILVPPRSTPTACIRRCCRSVAAAVNVGGRREGAASSLRLTTRSAQRLPILACGSRRLGGATKTTKKGTIHDIGHRARRLPGDRGRPGDRGDQGLRAGPDRGAGAGQPLGGAAERPLHRHHGPLGVGEVHADALPRGAGPDHLGPHLHRRRGAEQAVGEAAHPAAPRQGRLRVPVVQPAADPDRGRERGVAAGDRRAQAGPLLGRHRDRRGGAA